MSKPLSPDQAIDTMRRNKPALPTTFGPCCRGCGRSARDCGVCFECARADLAGHVGDGLANEMAHAVLSYTVAYRMILEHMDAREPTHHERKATDGEPSI